MTTYGHFMVMKRAKVSDLKARLSGYLASVRAGDTVVVCDRNTPIARIVPYDERDDGFVVHEAEQPGADVRKIPRVKPRKRVDVVRMLREDRDQR
jgi:prevent-host-death family protein